MHCKCATMQPSRADKGLPFPSWHVTGSNWNVFQSTTLRKVQMQPIPPQSSKSTIQKTEENDLSLRQ